MFYNFAQNNSWGSFIEDDRVWEYVFIEASSRDEANDKAESIGIYFDGCDTWSDCECCGDRWNRQWDKGISFPYEYPVRELLTSWSKDNSAEKKTIEKAVLKKYGRKAYRTFSWHNSSVPGWSEFRGTLVFKNPEQYAAYLMNPHRLSFYRSDASVKIYYAWSYKPVVVQDTSKKS